MVSGKTILTSSLPLRNCWLISKFFHCDVTNSALIRSHPYLSFLFFFPTFLLTELLAALSVYAYFVLRPSISDDSESQELREIKREFEEDDSELVEEEEEQEKEIKREIKEEFEEEELTSEPPSVVTETEEEEESLESEERFRRERRRERLMREAGPGGKGMSEIQGESLTETEEEEDGGESGEGSEEWEGVAVPPSGEEAEVREKDFDDTATIGGVRLFTLSFSCLKSCVRWPCWWLTARRARLQEPRDRLLDLLSQGRVRRELQLLLLLRELRKGWGNDKGEEE